MEIAGPDSPFWSSARTCHEVGKPMPAKGNRRSAPAKRPDADGFAAQDIAPEGAQATTSHQRPLAPNLRPAPTPGEQHAQRLRRRSQGAPHDCPQGLAASNSQQPRRPGPVAHTIQGSRRAGGSHDPCALGKAHAQSAAAPQPLGRPSAANSAARQPSRRAQSPTPVPPPAPPIHMGRLKLKSQPPRQRVRSRAGAGPRDTPAPRTQSRAPGAAHIR